MPLELTNTPLASDANLKGYYRFEANGNDSSGNGNNLSTVIGSPSYTSGYFGNGAMFDNGESISLANNLGIDNGNFSMSIWVKLTAEITGSAFWFIQLNGGDAVDTGMGIQYEYNAGTRRLYFDRVKWNVAHQGVYYNISLGTSNWYHIVLTYDGSNLRGYLNGSLVAGPTAASGNGSGTTSALTSIGIAGTTCAGLIDDVAIFNRVLTQSEITSIYQGDGWTASTNYLTNYRNRKRVSGAVSV